MLDSAFCAINNFITIWGKRYPQVFTVKTLAEGYRKMTQKGSPLADWSSDQVVAAVRAKGITMQELSESFGLNKGALYRALRSPSYPAHEVRIARFLGLEVSDIWPARCATRLAEVALKAEARRRIQKIKTELAA